MDYLIKIADQLKQQLKSLRKARGMSQSELGRRIGVTQARITEIENNPAPVGVEQILKILSVLSAELVVRYDEPPATLASNTPAAARADVPPPSETKPPATVPGGLGAPAAKGRW